MRNTHTRILILLTLAILALGGIPATARAAQDAGAPAPQSIPEGKKTSIKGVVVAREADSFHVKDAKAVETIVMLTDATRVQVDGKAISDAQRYELRKVVSGLIVQVDGRGDAQGNLVADKVRISNKDFRSAVAIASSVNPVASRVTDVEKRATAVEHQQQVLAGQVDELTALSTLARQEAERANQRITALDNYDVTKEVAVTFAVNKAILTPEAMKSLDELAAQAQTLKGYAIEITGYTDTTGNAERNRILSDQRANTVTRYLTDKHGIPLRRIVTPLGYGQAKAIADNSTPEGRAQNRRVEVKLMQQGGINQ
jgi:outer membrane protein OmpA-like peptidoglycan-associated protein